MALRPLSRDNLILMCLIIVFFSFAAVAKNKYKALFWDGDGFMLLYKRIEKGKIKWPRTNQEVRNITQRELRWLLEGLKIDQPKAIQQVDPAGFY